MRFEHDSRLGVYIIWQYSSFMQILPVNIKSLGGSVATLANWLTSWVVTMTANLLLTWSEGGFTSLLFLCCCKTSLKHSKKLFFSQEHSLFMQWCRLLQLFLLDFGFLKPKEEHLKRFSVPSDDHETNYAIKEYQIERVLQRGSISFMITEFYLL